MVRLCQCRCGLQFVSAKNILKGGVYTKGDLKPKPNFVIALMSVATETA